jgi:hypothetical protein
MRMTFTNDVLLVRMKSVVVRKPRGGGLMVCCGRVTQGECSVNFRCMDLHESWSVLAETPTTWRQFFRWFWICRWHVVKESAAIFTSSFVHTCSFLATTRLGGLVCLHHVYPPDSTTYVMNQWHIQKRKNHKHSRRHGDTCVDGQPENDTYWPRLKHVETDCDCNVPYLEPLPALIYVFKRTWCDTIEIRKKYDTWKNTAMTDTFTVFDCQKTAVPFITGGRY